MTLPCTIQDLEHKKFVECPDGSNKPAVRTKICQDSGEAIRVEIGNKGTSTTIPNTINSVTPTSNSLIVSYTVPVGKVFDLSKIICSGDNISKYRVYVAGSLCYTKRSTWGDFNIDFDLLEAIVLAGDKIEVFAENFGKKNSDYEATIIGGLSNA